MILVDTSVWIEVLRDRQGTVTQRLRDFLGDRLPVLTRFTQLELLQGARDQKEWNRLYSYLETQVYLEASARTWPEAALIYFDLRRNGKTVRSPIDCCIAQLALEHDVLLLHRDQDFTTISQTGSLKHEFF